MRSHARWFLAAALLSFAAGPALAAGSSESPSGHPAAAARLAQDDLVAPLFTKPSAQVCAAVQRESCGSDWLTKAGPGPVQDCCERHVDFCGDICNCGYTGVNCFDNGHGGCSSTCVGCRICI